MNIRRLYFNLRMGQTAVFPIISMINFIIISYSLTTIKDVIPIHVYIPIFTITLISMLMVIGYIFRKKQQSTDFALTYENNIELVKTLDAILTGDTKKIQERNEYHKKIIRSHTK